MNRKRLYTLVLGFSGLSYLYLIYTAFRIHAPLNVTVCHIKRFTGYPCPSCGTTTAALLALQGNVYAAFMVNPIGLLAVIMLVFFPLWIFLDLYMKDDSFFRFFERFQDLFKNNRYFLAAFVLLIITNWIWNFLKIN